MSTSNAVGVDLGGTKMHAGVVDDAGEVLHHATALEFGDTSDAILDALAEEVGEVLSALPGTRAEAVGLGIPCTIDRASGVAISAVNLPIVDVPVRDEMRRRLDLPVFVDNDANVAALAEHRFGAAKGADNVVMLTIGTGIGGGLILDGRIYRGATGAGAELGHVVVDADGPPCQGNCPNNGCVETLASGTALAREGRAAARGAPESRLGRMASAGERIDGRAVTEAALAADAVAREVVTRAGRSLGVALTSIANVFEPDVIVLGGGVMAVGELMLAPARSELGARALPPMNRTPIVAAALGPSAGLVGAATMALDELAAVTS